MSFYRMDFFLFWIFLFGFNCYDSTNITILFMYSGNGPLKGYADYSTIIRKWSNYMFNGRDSLRNSLFQVQVEIEAIDVNSSEIETRRKLLYRLSESEKSDVTAIVGPESDLGSKIVAPIAQEYEIPSLLVTSSPWDQVSRNSGGEIQFTYFMQPQESQSLSGLFDLYEEAGVNDVVLVVSRSTMDYDYGAFIDEVTVMIENKGIILHQIFSFFLNVTTSEINEIVFELRRIDPDAVVWYDLITEYNEDFFQLSNPLPKLKEINYLPKVFSMIDHSLSPYTSSLRDQGYLDYVTFPTYFHKDLKGQEYTQDDYPYANLFRPKTQINTIEDALNIGTSSSSPSSSSLFYDWYKNETGRAPTSQTVALWALLDILDVALHKTFISETPEGPNAHILPAQLALFLNLVSVSGPYGRVGFDAHHVNSLSSPIAVQLLAGKVEPDIIWPSSQRTHEFVYPMPTWDERVYRWRLLQGFPTVIAIAICSVCCVIILAVMITIIVHRKDVKIRVLNFGHLVSICVSAIVICLTMTFIKQPDMLPIQCDLYLWCITIPMSYMVQLTNMTAYRLSLFLHNDRQPQTIQRLKKFSHRKVLQLTLLLVSITGVVLILCELLDRPRLVRVSRSQYRPGLDYHKCRFGRLTRFLYLFVIIGHGLFCIYCVSKLRRGLQGFKDGIAIHDSFMIFNPSFIAYLIVDNVDLDVNTIYVLRNGILGIGTTLFILRLLISRCASHWLSESVLKEVYRLLSFFRTKRVKRPASDSSWFFGLRNADEPVSAILNSGRLRSSANNRSSQVEEILSVVQDPDRSIVLKAVADQLGFGPTYNCLCAILEYKDKTDRFLINSSICASKDMMKQAQELFNKYIRVNSEKEVNISHKTRSSVEKILNSWNASQQLITVNMAEKRLHLDPLHRSRIFDSMRNEIARILYEGLWSQFLVLETAHQISEITLSQEVPGAYVSTNSENLQSIELTGIQSLEEKEAL